MLKCFICDSELGEGTGVTEVKQGGIESLSQANVKRKDGKVSVLKGMTSTVIHTKY